MKLILKADLLNHVSSELVGLATYMKAEAFSHSGLQAILNKKAEKKAKARGITVEQLAEEVEKNRKDSLTDVLNKLPFFHNIKDATEKAFSISKHPTEVHIDINDECLKDMFDVTLKSAKISFKHLLNLSTELEVLHQDHEHLNDKWLPEKTVTTETNTVEGEVKIVGRWELLLGKSSETIIFNGKELPVVFAKKVSGEEQKRFVVGSASVLQILDPKEGQDMYQVAGALGIPLSLVKAIRIAHNVHPTKF